MKGFCIMVLLGLVSSFLGAETIEKAYSRHFEESEIKTIGEFWGREDGTLYRSRFQSDPESLSGRYFIFRMPKGTTEVIELSVIRSDRTKAESKEFRVLGEDLKDWIYLGLTGKDWPDPELEPLAWRVRLIAPGGSIHSEWKSFLWEME